MVVVKYEEKKKNNEACVDFEEARKLVPEFKAAKAFLDTGSNSYVVESTILNVMRDHPSELHTIDVSGCTNSTARVLDSLVARPLLTSLRHLDLGGCGIQGNFPDALYEQLFQMDFFRFMGNSFANVGEQTLKKALIFEFNTIKDQRSIVLARRSLKGGFVCACVCVSPPAHIHTSIQLILECIPQA